MTHTLALCALYAVHGNLIIYFCIAAAAMSRCSSSGVMNTHVPSGMPKNEGRSSELGPEMTAVWASWLAKSGHFLGSHPDTFVRMRVDFGVGYTKGLASIIW